MIVRMPDQHARAVGLRRRFRRLAWIAAPADQIAVIDRIVLAVEHLALPLEVEDALGCAALVAAVLIDRPPALRRPPHDLDLRRREIALDAPIALQRLLGRRDDLDLMLRHPLCQLRRRPMCHGASPYPRSLYRYVVSMSFLRTPERHSMGENALRIKQWHHRC